MGLKTVDKAKLMDECIRTFEANGGTNISEGLFAGIDQLERASNGIRVVDANMGITDPALLLAETNVQMERHRAN